MTTTPRGKGEEPDFTEDELDAADRAWDALGEQTDVRPNDLGDEDESGEVAVPPKGEKGAKS